MNKRFWTLLLLTLLLSLTLGCGVCGLVGGETEESSETEEIEPVEEAEPVEESEPVEQDEETEQDDETEQDISISSVVGGLQELDSYRSHMRMVFEGSEGDEDEQWGLEMDMEYVREPFAQRIVIQGGNVGIVEGGSMESVQIGDQQYAVFGDQCITSSNDDGGAMDAELFELDDMMGGLDNASRVMPDETVNGILCRHYEFDETAIAWTVLTEASGEVWIAVDGDYVVKYTMVAEGQDPASQQQGHVEWEYEVSDVNVPISIEPPAGCADAGSEFPIMPDATSMNTFGGMVSYQSASTFDDVVAFYQDQMAAEGWTNTGDGLISAGTAMLNFTRDGDSAAVTITGADGTVSVIIMSE